MRFPTKAVTQAVVSTVLVLLAVEVLARLEFTLRSTLTELRTPRQTAATWYRYSADLGWERRPGYSGIDNAIDRFARSYDSQGLLDMDSKKPAGNDTQTVLFIGDSNTYGYGVPPEASFPEVTGQLLPGVRTINLGTIGYTSYQGRKIFERYVPQFHPNLVVVSFNFNDRREVAQGEEDGPAHFRRVYEANRNPAVSLNERLDVLYSWREIEAAMLRFGLIRSRDITHVPVDKLRPRVDEKSYRDNLSAIAQQARAAGIPLVFVLLRDNPLEAGYLNHGVENMKNGEYDAAVEDFSVLVRGKSMHADLGRIFLARAYREMGKDKEAAAALRDGDRMDFLHGGNPLVPDWEYNAIMRDVAGEFNVPLVDAASVLEKDPYVYFDFCHFGSVGHRKVAELLAAELPEIMKAGPAGMLGRKAL
jgi:lysophospholipase L1-like esterase